MCGCMCCMFDSSVSLCYLWCVCVCGSCVLCMVVLCFVSVLCFGICVVCAQCMFDVYVLYMFIVCWYI